MNLGDLIVFLRANTADFTKGTQGALEGLKRLADQVKRASMEFSRAGAEISAMATGALLLASKHSQGAQQQFAAMERASVALAMQVANVLGPAFKQVTQTIQGVANVIATMSPAQRAAASRFVEIAATVGIAAKALSTISGVVAGIASVLGLLAGAAVPLLAIVVALAAVAAAVLFVHKMWRENWGNIQQMVANLAGDDGPLAAIGHWFVSLGKMFLDNFVQSVLTGMDLVVTAISQGLEMLAKVQNGMGDTEAAQKTLAQSFMLTRGAINIRAGVENTLTSSHIGDTLSAGMKTAIAGLKEAGGALKDEAKIMFAPLMKMIDDFVDRFNGAKGVAPTMGNLDTAQMNAAFLKALESFGLAPNNVTPGGKFIKEGTFQAVEQANADFKRMDQLQAHRLGMGGLISGGAVALSATATRQGTEESISIVEEGLLKIGEYFPAFTLGLRSAGEALVTFAQNQLAQLGAAVGQVAQNFSSKLGNLGSTISAGVSGAQSGGVFGAIGAVIVEMFSQAKQFTRVTYAAQGAFMKALLDLGPAFANLAAALQTFMGAVQPVANALHSMIAPVLNFVGGILVQIGPLFWVIGQVLAAIAPALQSLAGVLQILQPIFWLLFQVFRGIGIVVAGLVLALETAWNGMVDALWSVLQWVESIIGENDALDSLMLSISKMAVDTSGASSALDNLINSTYEQVQASNQNTGAQLEAAGAAAAVASMFQQMITNAPSGFKVGAYEYGATSTIAELGGNPNAAVGGTTVQGDVQIFVGGVTDPQSFANTLGETIATANYQKTGRPSNPFKPK